MLRLSICGCDLHSAKLGWGTERNVQKKIYWLLVAILGLIADIVLPFTWALIATVPILIVCWFIVYRTDWF